MKIKQNLLNTIILVFSAVFVLFVLVDTTQVLSLVGFVLTSGQARAIALGFVLVILFLLNSAKRKRISWYDCIMIAMCFASTIYIVILGPTLAEGSAYATNLDAFFGLCLFIPLVEGMRRTGNTVVIIIGAVFLAYAYFANYFPGMLWGPGWGLRRLVSYFYIGNDGIYGEAMAVFTYILIPFLAFGAFLKATGISEFFVDVANSLTGWSRGGPAKAGVFGSSLMGMVSGSGMANVATVGTVTIPLMIKTGYKPEVAAAIEAAASTGGQIMPPVMGVAAFLMADYLGIPYVKVAASAALPAVFYYLFLFTKVDIEAKKAGLKGVPRNELPSFKEVMKKNWYYLIPVAGLVITLAVLSWRVELCAILGILLCFPISFIKKETALTPKRIVQALESAARGSISVGALCAGIGLIIGTFNLTGLGINLSNILVDLAGGNITILLILTAIIAIILGMGMPTAGVYLICALMLGPALIKLGLPPIAAHMFILYFGLASLVTPPVALAAYTAAPIAGANPFKTSWLAALISLPLYVVPFIFVNYPGLLLIGNAKDIIIAILVVLGALMGWFYAIEGHSFLSKIDWRWRLPALLGLFLIVYPSFIMTLIGTGIILLIFLIDIFIAIKLKVRS